MITVVIPVSPVPSHPNIDILTETVESVRHHLKDAEIILTFDGVRAEQEHRHPDYEEAIRRTLWKADHAWGNVAPFIFDTHCHQVGMMRGIIDEIRTDLLMYVESDTPLVTDEPIDWKACTELIQSGQADIVRYAHEAHILPDHMHMMLGQQGQFVRTCQFSARPHLASVNYYRRVLKDHFSPNANCFCEDVLHGICHEAYNIDGMAGWQRHRLWIYHPDGGNIKRSYHLDARDGGPKYDTSQVF